MQHVSQEAFFAKINPLDVHPRVDVRTFKGRYHVSHWEMQDNARNVVGRTESDSWGVEPTKCFLATP